MNKFLCESNSITFSNVTTYQFPKQLSDVSIHLLPILALAGNSLTLLVIFTNSHLNRSSFAVYVKTLAVSDTAVLLFKFFSYQNKTSRRFYFPSLCTILVFCGEASVLLSVWAIVAITIERTLVVLFPFHRKKFVSAYRARMAILGIFVGSVAFSARILVVPIDRSVNPVIRCQSSSNWTSYRNINMTITEFGYCYIPLALVIVGNLLTVSTVKRAFLQRHDLITNHSFHQKRRVETSENQLMLMLLIVTLMFIINFVPFTIMNIVARWGLPFRMCFTQRSFGTYLILRSLCELLKDLNFCTNFLVYCLSGRRFRYAFCSLYKCHRRRQSVLSPGNIQLQKGRGYYSSKSNSEQHSGRKTLEDTHL